jgi:hypothetical protein
MTSQSSLDVVDAVTMGLRFTLPVAIALSAPYSYHSTVERCVVSILTASLINQLLMFEISKL